MSCGIYCITNKTTGKKYVGSSKNIERRWKTHSRNLRSQKHVNVILQNAWDKYGEGDFGFSILEECELCELTTREQVYIDSGEFEFNIAKDPVFSMLGLHHSEETKRKTSQSLMGHPVSERVRLSTSERFRGNKIWVGRTHTEESKRKMSLAKKGKPGTSLGTKRSPETCKKIGESKRGNHYRLGSRHTEEAKRKMSAARAGKHYPGRKRRKGYHHTEQWREKIMATWALKRASASHQLPLGI